MSSQAEETVAWLKSQGTLTLATVGKDGRAQAASLFYVADSAARLYWFSSASSAHSRNVKARPDAAVSIYRPTEQWREIQGVQMRGRVEVVRDRAQREALTAVYVERFQLGTVFAAAIASSRLYVFRPNWARWIDNTRGFGHKVEFRLDS